MADQEAKDKTEKLFPTGESVDSHNNDATGTDNSPFIMQSSDLPFDGLDIKYEEGGNRTSDDEIIVPSEKNDSAGNGNKTKSESKTGELVQSIESLDSSNVNSHLMQLSKLPFDGLHIRHEKDGNKISNDNNSENTDLSKENAKPSQKKNISDSNYDETKPKNESEGLIETVESLDSDNSNDATNYRDSPLNLESSKLPIDRLEIMQEGSDIRTSDYDNTENSDISKKNENIEPPKKRKKDDTESSYSETKPQSKTGELLQTIEYLDSSNISDATGNTDLPLIMQSSNLTFDRLDIRHEGGGNRTSNDNNMKENSGVSKENIEPPKKKKKGDLDSNYHETKSKSETKELFQNMESFDSNSDATCDADKPLVMQSSNGPFVRFDTEREEGETRTSDEDDNDDSDVSNENDEESEPPKQKLKNNSDCNYNETKSNSSLDNTQDDKGSFFDKDSNFLFSRETNSAKMSEFENDITSDAQISSNAGVMEFDILDEFESNDNDNDNEEDYASDSSDISLNELDALLDASLENGKNDTAAGPDEQQHEEKQKIILKVRGRDHFDVLPEGWIEVTHNSGMPIYLHKSTRVCSVSKPYFLGPGSTRKHEIPVTAIPCLHYLKELEKERMQQEQKENSEETSDALPSAKLESVKDNKESGSLDYMAVREYCMKRFEFQTITVKRFKTWCGRRMHQKQLRQKQRPTLPDSTKLITCPLPPASDKSAPATYSTKREFIMNPSGKSPVCILHEYVQHTLRLQPKYIFKELENASTPYGAVVMINDMEYGYGYGSSKKLAKSEAAKAALDVLIPKMKVFGAEEKSEDQQDLEFFDQVRVEDPRICELSVKAGQPYPYQILLECLKRNYGMGDTEIVFSMQNLKHQKNEFKMTVGKHSVTVICKNKRDGKHRASQAILQLLHPHINSWGSLLRMYGKGSCKTLKEKKEEEQRITELQSQACANKPNMSILNKLKEEMLKYREKMKMKKPIGKLIPEQMELSTSDSNLRNVEL